MSLDKTIDYSGWRLALVVSLVVTGMAQAAPHAASHLPASQARGSINSDAMTMQKCRERLAMPKNVRPKDDDPRVNLDGVCDSMLKSPVKAPAPHPASASSAVGH